MANCTEEGNNDKEPSFCSNYRVELARKGRRKQMAHLVTEKKKELEKEELLLVILHSSFASLVYHFQKLNLIC